MEDTLLMLQQLQFETARKGSLDSFFLDIFACDKEMIISVSAYKTEDFEAPGLSVCKRIYNDTPKTEIDNIIKQIKALCI